MQPVGRMAADTTGLGSHTRVRRRAVVPLTFSLLQQLCQHDLLFLALAANILSGFLRSITRAGPVRRTLTFAALCRQFCRRHLAAKAIQRAFRQYIRWKEFALAALVRAWGEAEQSSRWARRASIAELDGRAFVPIWELFCGRCVPLRAKQAVVRRLCQTYRRHFASGYLAMNEAKREKRKQTAQDRKRLYEALKPSVRTVEYHPPMVPERTFSLMRRIGVHLAPPHGFKNHLRDPDTFFGVNPSTKQYWSDFVRSSSAKPVKDTTSSELSDESQRVIQKSQEYVKWAVECLRNPHSVTAAPKITLDTVTAHLVDSKHEQAKLRKQNGQLYLEDPHLRSPGTSSDEPENESLEDWITRHRKPEREESEALSEKDGAHSNSTAEEPSRSAVRRQRARERWRTAVKRVRSRSCPGPSRGSATPPQSATNSTSDSDTTISELASQNEPLRSRIRRNRRTSAVPSYPQTQRKQRDSVFRESTPGDEAEGLQGFVLESKTVPRHINTRGHLGPIRGTRVRSSSTGSAVPAPSMEPEKPFAGLVIRTANKKAPFDLSIQGISHVVSGEFNTLSAGRTPRASLAPISSTSIPASPESIVAITDLDVPVQLAGRKRSQSQTSGAAILAPMVRGSRLLTSAMTDNHSPALTVPALSITPAIPRAM
eukprot:TRINITY_DN3846_c0_g1_i1.p1 TRINITY_DN3846_c0_g1~~TRINITY_DN3846_c0_g1_i1.p1  ORF type:complete len:672 (+),score=41.80 TRINITY_DN3846_c0_g1_i1:51-2018(+)